MSTQETDQRRQIRLAYMANHPGSTPSGQFLDDIELIIDSAKREELIKIHTFHEGRFMTIEDRIKELEQSEESE